MTEPLTLPFLNVWRHKYRLRIQLHEPSIEAQKNVLNKDRILVEIPVVFATFSAHEVGAEMNMPISYLHCFVWSFAAKN